jgi:hypothetical protein
MKQKILSNVQSIPQIKPILSFITAIMDMVDEVMTTILLSLNQTPIFLKNSLEYNGQVVWIQYQLKLEIPLS